MYKRQHSSGERIGFDQVRATRGLENYDRTHFLRDYAEIVDADNPLFGTSYVNTITNPSGPNTGSVLEMITAKRMKELDHKIEAIGLDDFTNAELKKTGLFDVDALNEGKSFSRVDVSTDRYLIQDKRSFHRYEDDLGDDVAALDYLKIIRDNERLSKGRRYKFGYHEGQGGTGTLQVRYIERLERLRKLHFPDFREFSIDDFIRIDPPIIE